MAFGTKEIIALGLDGILQNLKEKHRPTRQNFIEEFGQYFNKDDKELMAAAIDLFRAGHKEMERRIEEGAREGVEEWRNKKPEGLEGIKHSGEVFLDNLAGGKFSREESLKQAREKAKDVAKEMGIDSPKKIFALYKAIRREVYDDHMVPAEGGGFRSDGFLDEPRYRNRPDRTFKDEPITKEKMIEWGLNDMQALSEKKNPDEADGLMARLNQEKDGPRRKFRGKFAHFFNLDNPGIAKLAEEMYPLLDEKLAAIAAETGSKEIDKVRQNALSDVARLSVPSKEQMKNAAGVLIEKVQRTLSGDWKIAGWKIGRTDLGSVLEDGAKEKISEELAKIKSEKHLESAADLEVLLKKTRGAINDRDIQMTRLANGAVKFSRNSLLANADGPRGAPIVASADATSAVAKANIGAVIDKGMVDTRKKPFTQKSFEENLMPADMTARNHKGYFKEIAEGNINAWDKKSSVIIGKNTYDLSKPDQVARLKNTIKTEADYTAFLAGHLVDSVQLAAAEKVKLAADQKAPDTKAAATPTVTQTSGSPLGRNAQVRQPISLTTAANAAQTPASAAPAPSGKNEPTSAAITRQAQDNIQREKGLANMAYRYLTGEGMSTELRDPQKINDFKENMRIATNYTTTLNGRILEGDVPALHATIKKAGYKLVIRDNKIEMVPINPSPNNNLASTQ